MVTNAHETITERGLFEWATFIVNTRFEQPTQPCPLLHEPNRLLWCGVRNVITSAGHSSAHHEESKNKKGKKKQIGRYSSPNTCILITYTNDAKRQRMCDSASQQEKKQTKKRNRSHYKRRRHSQHTPTTYNIEGREGNARNPRLKATKSVILFAHASAPTQTRPTHAPVHFKRAPVHVQPEPW